VIRLPAIPPGGNTGWVTPPFPGSVDVMVRVGTFNAGTRAEPSYNYFLRVRNRYTEGVNLSVGMKLGDPNVKTTDRDYIGPNQAKSFDMFFYSWTPSAPIWLRLDGVKFRNEGAPWFCSGAAK
jgi:hypothetical protein